MSRWSINLGVSVLFILNSFSLPVITFPSLTTYLQDQLTQTYLFDEVAGNEQGEFMQEGQTLTYVYRRKEMDKFPVNLNQVIATLEKTLRSSGKEPHSEFGSILQGISGKLIYGVVAPKDDRHG